MTNLVRYISYFIRNLIEIGLHNKYFIPLNFDFYFEFVFRDCVGAKILEFRLLSDRLNCICMHRLDKNEKSGEIDLNWV